MFSPVSSGSHFLQGWIRLVSSGSLQFLGMQGVLMCWKGLEVHPGSKSGQYEIFKESFVLVLLLLFVKHLRPWELWDAEPNGHLVSLTQHSNCCGCEQSKHGLTFFLPWDFLACLWISGFQSRPV